LGVDLGAINEGIADGLAPFQIKDYSSLPDWADENFFLASESSSISGPWETLPYQRGLMLVMADEDIEVFTWLKSKQIGATKMMCADVLYHCEYKRRNIVFFQPTETEAKGFCEEEIDSVLRSTLLGHALSVDPNKKHRDNTSTRKRFKNGALLDIRGGKSERNYRRLTKDRVYYDDADGFDSEIESSGDPFSLGDDRVSTSSFPKSIRASTPRTDGDSLISSSYEQAEIQISRYVPCPDCGHYQPLRWVNFVKDESGERLPLHACECCGHEMRYPDMQEADAQGIWRSPVDKKDTLKSYDPKDERFIYLDETTGEFRHGKEVKNYYHVGAFIWSAYSYFISWERLTRKFNEARAELKKNGSTKKLKTFINTDLAETWKEQGEVPAIELVHEKQVNYELGTVAKDTVALTCGVDVGADGLYVQIRSFNNSMGSRLVLYQEIGGDIEESQVWERLDTIRRKIYDGFPVALTFVDSGYNTDVVYPYCKEHAGENVYAIKGRDTMQELVRKSKVNRKAGRGQEIRLYLINTDHFKVTVHTRLKNKADDPRAFLIPTSIQEAYCQGLVAEERMETKAGKWVWKQRHKYNEPFDTAVYAYAAAHRKNVTAMTPGPAETEPEKSAPSKTVTKDWDEYR